MDFICEVRIRLNLKRIAGFLVGYLGMALVILIFLLVLAIFI